MQFVARLEENRRLGAGGFVLVLGGCEALAGAAPGQFVMVRGAWGRDPLLPRAFSILRTQPGGRAEILVKAVGKGTRLLAELAVGAELSVLGPLGGKFSLAAAAATNTATTNTAATNTATTNTAATNTATTNVATANVATTNTATRDVLVAGGVGLAPLLWYAEVAARAGVATELIYGARSAGDLVLLDEIARAKCALTVTTEDGSRGITGRVTDALAARLADDSQPRARVLTCGPNPMMRAVVALAHARSCECLVSVEGEMACGIGVCLGCAVPHSDEVRAAGGRPFAYACIDGPVFDAARIVIP